MRASPARLSFDLLKSVAQPHLNALSDDELLNRFVAGDENCFRALVARYTPLVWGVCSRSLATTQDAEDAFQATFLVLFRKAAGLDRRGHLSLWLYGVARKAALRVRTTVARRREVPVDSLAAVPESTVEPDREFSRVLEEEIARLPENLRRPFILCRLQDNTYAEAAKILGCSVATVCRRVDQAIVRLRDRLSGRGIAPTCSIAGVLVLEGISKAAPLALADTVAALLAGSPSQAAVAVADSLCRSLVPWAVRTALLIGFTGAVGLGALASVAPDAEPIAAAPAVRPAGVVENAVPRVDHSGDPLPDGALSRIGTLRFRAARFGATEDVVGLARRGELASVHGMPELILWERGTGKKLHALEAPRGSQWIAASDDGSTLVVAGTSDVWAWDLAENPPKPKWKWKGDVPANSTLTALATAPGGGTVAVSDSGGHTWVLDGKTGELRVALDGISRTLAYAGKDRLVAASGPDAEAARVVIWDLATQKVRHAIDAPQGETVADVAVAPDGKSLAWLGTKGQVRLVDIESGKEQRAWQAGTNPCGGILFEDDGKTVVSVRYRAFGFVDSATGEESRPSAFAPGLWLNKFSNFHNGKRLLSDKNQLATVSQGRVAIWDLNSGRPTGPAGQILGAIRHLSFSPDGRSLTTFADRAFEAQVWNAETGEPGPRLEPQAKTEAIRYPYGIGWNGEQPVTLTHGGKGTVVIRWDRKTGKVAETIEMPNEARVVSTYNGMAPFDATASGAVAVGSNDKVVVRSAAGKTINVSVEGRVQRVALSSDARTLLAVSWSNAGGPNVPIAQVWSVDAEKPRELNRPRFESYMPWANALSADGRWVATVSRERSVMLTETYSGGAGLNFPFKDDLHSLAFSADGRLLAGGDIRGTVTVWDLLAGEEVQQFKGHTNPITVVAFSPDGTRLSSGSEDGTALVWKLPRRQPTADNRTLDRLCSALAGDPESARKAEFALMARPEAAVEALAERMLARPAAPPNAADIRKWIADLDAPLYETREAAQGALQAAGEAVVPDLRRALQGDPSPEVKARLTWIIDRLESPVSPARMQAARGIAVLEAIGSPAARRLLEKIATREAGGPPAAEAKAALQRLEVKAP